MRLGKDKQAFLLVISLAFSWLSQGQPPKSFKQAFTSGLQDNSVVSTDHSLIINYSLPEVTLEEFNSTDGSFYRINAPGHIHSAVIGKPEMPVMSRLIEIPEGCTWKITITNVASTSIKPSRNRISGRLFPVQEGETKNQQQGRRPVVIDKAVYASRGFIGTDTVRIEPVGIIRHKHFANLLISPAAYDPSSNKIRIIKSMKIEITFIPSGTKSLNAAIPESRLFRESVGKGVLNYDPLNVVPGYSDKPVRMIILTDTTYKKLIKPFVQWKTQKGFRIQVLYKGTGYAGDNYTAIKNTLASIYNSSTADNPPPEYLLIIGDGNKIPYSTSGNYTDMYYGEYDGGGDYLPDLYTGRIPAKDTNDLKIVLNKIIQYEKYRFAASNKFTGNSLITAGVDYDNQRYMNGQVYYGYSNYLNPANKINGYHFYYPASASAKDSIVKIINKGISFLNYTGHGASDGWLYIPFKNSDIAALTNKDMYPFIVSNACSTSTFYSPSSFGNQMVTAQNKGAVGFIGCSDNSYWDEDYFWAVGVGSISAEPTYETTGLGALDRLFHTHGEKPSDWYISMGQVNYAGNLAVSSSTSSKKKYYWETYNLVGDPSVIPFIGTPDTFNIVLPDTLPNNLSTLSLVTEPFAYIGITHADTLVTGAFASESGSLTINIPGYSNDSIHIVLSGQNRKPLIKTIRFSNTGREFVNLKSSSITDLMGNNNGLADFGESIMLNMSVANSGTKSTVNLYAKVSSSSPWVTVPVDSVIIGTISPGSEINLDDNFPLKIASGVPDRELITLDLLLKDNKEEKKYRIDICAHAPSLDITGLLIDDTETGNGNYTPDPGETVKLQFTVSNSGTSNTSGQFTVSSLTPGVSLIEPTKSSGMLSAGESSSIAEPLKLSDNISIGTTVNVTASLNCDPIHINRDFSFKVGRIRESFESSSFRIFPWINKSQYPWLITNSSSFDGRIAARSGTITHNQSSSLSIRTNYEESDSVRFYYRVSSEAGYDYLYVKVNDVIIFRKSGEIPWSRGAVFVPAGFDKIEWIYAKDGSVSSGLDCAMIDMIDFAGSGTVKYISKDISVARISSPVNKDQLGSGLVVAKLLNLAPDTIQGFNLAYSINGKPPVSQYFNKQLVPFSDSTTVAFNTPADLSAYGIYHLVVYSFSNADDYLLNDTARVSIVNTDIVEPFTVCPNPFTNELQVIINTESSSAVHLTLSSRLGVIVKDLETEIVTGRNVITIKDLQVGSGVYYLRIEYSGLTRTVPVVKIK